MLDKIRDICYYIFNMIVHYKELYPIRRLLR